jgi:hypothetical protein
MIIQNPEEKTRKVRRIVTKSVNFPAQNTPVGSTVWRSKLVASNYIQTMRLLAEVVHIHPWTFATLDAVTRSVIGSGWKIIPREGKEKYATRAGKRVIENFLYYRNRRWRNIRDFIEFPQKLSQTISSYRLFGQASWSLVRDGDKYIGFDVLSGITIPNVDENGNLLSPAFIHKPWDKSKDLEFELDEIVYFCNPGVTGRILGESPYEALLEVTLPSDLYAAVTYRSVLENVNAPYNGVWVVDPSVSDEDFEMFVTLLQERYTGPENFGRNPLVIRGMAEFKEIETGRKDTAPYIDGRSFSREEIIGVTGVAANKIGLSGDFNKANLREARREFHEAVLRPLFEAIEDVINEQVFVRVLGVEEWVFRFNRPDITTALEQAAIDMRYLQWGVLSPNEVRRQHGLDPRENGDDYYVPSETTSTIIQGGQQGKKEIDDEESIETMGDIPSNPRPPRDEEMITNSLVNRSTIKNELKNWRRIVLEYMDGKRRSKYFVPRYIPKPLYNQIERMLSCCEDFDSVKKVFAAAIELYEGDYVGENA